ncbi:hypothetical protein [Aestuariivirga sp.]|uniref:DUF7220 family protein n=1 Tax=Aestuariivirga sp. TaxID=2650926 RepID=UPI00359345F6
MSDAQRKALVIADNQLALNAGWDEAALSVLIQELDAEKFEIDLLGFAADDLDRYAIAVLTQMAVFPVFGLKVSLTENLVIGSVFTIISLARSYLLRRAFNALGQYRLRERRQ